MPPALNLLPLPRQLDFAPGSYSLAPGRLILVGDGTTAHSVSIRIRAAAVRLQKALAAAGLDWELTASPAVPPQLIGVALRLSPHPLTQPQGYRLQITTAGITIEGQDEAGIFYGVCTLIQIIKNSPISAGAPPDLPCLLITDWPDFQARGVMLDISRDKVPTMETLYHLVDLLAGWKINQLQLYTEHTFAYRNHPEVWAKASPLTGQEIMALDAFCQERFVDLVPNQNSFGHMHRWFDVPRYAPLGELYGVKLENWWGGGSFSLAPGDPGSLALIRGLYDELLPHFTSRMFNVGCDETFDLGKGRSKEACERMGTGRVYLNFLNQIYEAVRSHGLTMQFWGDIIMKYPQLVPELPKDAIALEWGYEAADPPADHCEKFATAGIPYYVCPGTSSWNSLAGRTDNALRNLRTAAVNGMKYGAAGYLNTDWGDNGHWQALPVSYTGFAAGAAYSWGYPANQELDLPAALSLHAFDDRSSSLGKVLYDLGNVYQAAGVVPGNSSALFHLYQASPKRILEYKKALTPETFDRIDEAIDLAMQPYKKAKPETPDAGLLAREFRLTEWLLRYAVQRGRWIVEPSSTDPKKLSQELQELIVEYKAVWLTRNRPGGLVDSAARFEKILLETLA